MRRERYVEEFVFQECIAGEKSFGSRDKALFFRSSSGQQFFYHYVDSERLELPKFVQDFRKKGVVIGNVVKIRYESDGYLSGAFGRKGYQLRYPQLVD